MGTLGIIVAGAIAWWWSGSFILAFISMGVLVILEAVRDRNVETNQRIANLEQSGCSHVEGEQS